MKHISTAATVAILLYSTQFNEQQFAKALKIHSLEEMGEVMEE
jgi:hypothetical protein